MAVLRGGASVLGSGEPGLLATELVAAALRSAETARPVKLLGIGARTTAAGWAPRAQLEGSYA